MKRNKRKLELSTLTVRQLSGQIRELHAGQYAAVNGGSLGCSHFDKEEVGASRHCVINRPPTFG